MSNNLVDLTGYLEIGSVEASPSAARSDLSLSGWIHTNPSAMGGRHPFLAEGKHAELILDQARKNSRMQIVDGGIEQNGVLARGKLNTFPGRCYLEVKHISFFDTSNPLPGAQLFTANHVRMQGYLILPHVKPGVIRQRTGQEGGLAAWFLTEPAASGGRHNIFLSGALAELADAHGKRTGAAVFQAVLGGNLVSSALSSFIHARYLSLNGIGYLDGEDAE